MMAKYFSGIIFFLLLLFISSCSSRSCTEDMTSKVHLSFYGYGDVNGKRTLGSFSMSSVVIQGVEASTFLYNSKSDTTFSKISLPLDQMHDTAIYNISLLGSWNDQLYVVYKRKNVFINYDCGFRTEGNLDTVWFKNHSQDTVYINKNQRYVSNSLLENCKIIFNSITGQ